MHVLIGSTTLASLAEEYMGSEAAALIRNLEENQKEEEE